MATPFEEFLRLQGTSMLPPPRPTAPAAPTFARSPYLTPQMSEALGTPFPTSYLGGELPGSAPVQPAPTPRAAPTQTDAPMSGGFSPASLALPRPIAKGKGPFDDFLATYNMGRMPVEPDPLAAMRQPTAEQASPFFLSAQGQQQVRGPGGQGASQQIDPRQMMQEEMLAQRYPRAIARIRQLREVGKRRGY